ncbi:MAG: DUF4127 family protein [Blastocatellia bacterium]
MIPEDRAMRRLGCAADRFHSPIRHPTASRRLLASFLILALTASSTTPSLAQRRPLLRAAARDYFAGKFVLIPLDERPPSLQQARMLARVADHDLILPPARAMAGANTLIEWAKSFDYAEADGVIISLDAIAGGSQQPQQLQQPDVVNWIRARRPSLAIYAFTASPSERLIQSALNLVAESELDFLLISGDGASRAKLPEEIAARRLGGKVAIEPDLDAATIILLSRMVNRRFGFTPKIFPVFSSVEGRNSVIRNSRNLPLSVGVSATIRSIGALEPSQPDSSQSNNTARSVDALLFVHTPRTPDANRDAMVEAIARNIENGAIVAVADISETKESKEAMIAALRRRKLLDKLISYASSDPMSPVGASTDAIGRAITHTSAFLNAVKFMRDDLGRVRRFDRAHFDLLFGRYLTDWAYALTVRPKLDDFVKSELKADPNRLEAATERAETFALEQVKQSAEQLFNEQFKRNIHAILLSTGERAQFEISMMQRLQVRLSARKTSDAEIRQSVYIPQINFPELSAPGGRARWFLESEGLDERIARRFDATDWGRFKSDVGEVEVNVKLAPREGSRESYTISNSRRREARRLTITAPSNQGVFYALGKLEMLGADGRLAEDFQISESPSLARRGVAEAFHGAPWSHGDRLETLRFLGLARMNRYVYAPKDEHWREDFSDEELERFKQLLRAAEENFVRVVYAIRPGSSIKYSSDEDAAALIRDLDAMDSVGARGFAICFDDAPATLQNGEDRARFKTLASAHAHLINRVYGRLKRPGADFELYVAPAVITDTRSGSDYLKELGAAIPQDVLFFRPGADSPEGANAQASEWSALANRRPVVWENFAANEDEPWRLFPGSMRGARVTLNEGANGFIATAMSQAQASMLPIVTAADYAWDSRNYNPRQSLDRALNLLYDARARAGLRLWTQVHGELGDGLFKSLFQKQAGEINVELIERKLAELQGAVEMIGVTLNQGLLRGELSRFIGRAQSAIEKLKNDPNYEKLPNGNFRLREK